jgi:flavin reductase (DIM6/NTAB) family NADH-FMN oxidoreductase RutF
MEPKIILVAVYHHTKTLSNLNAALESPVLLQLLSVSLAPVVRICGQQSGHDIDKLARLQKRFSMSTYHDLPYFTDAAGIMVLDRLTLQSCGGDHDLLTGTVLGSKNLHEVPLLTTDFLKTHKYIR